MYKVDSSMNPGLGGVPLLLHCHLLLCVCLSQECCRKRPHPLFMTPCDQKQNYAQSWFQRMRTDHSKSQIASSQTDAAQNWLRRSNLASFAWTGTEQESYWNYVGFYVPNVISIIQNTTQKYELYTSKWSVWLIEYTDIIKNLFTHLHKYTLRDYLEQV